jgi:HPt (histidine-containing phosphotransfer) domain-containing protein
MMPKMDGKETLERMKKEELIDENTKVIALTANAIQGAEEDYLKSGFDGYISKPIEMTTLEKALKKYLPDEVLKDDYASEEVIEFAPSSSETEAAADTVVPFTEKLNEKDFETDKALTFCAGDVEFYKEILSDYASSYEEKKKELDSSYDAGDWHDFEIKIHALKGVSKTIGATKLSEKAYELEKAASKNDADYIRQEYDAFMREYAKAADDIKQAGL